MANELSALHPAVGSRRRRMRIGRGEGSGKGKTAGRGTKGARSRASFKAKPGFEGGQMPLHRRLPKKGFRNIFSSDYTCVNVERLSTFAENETVTEALLKERGLVSRVGVDGVKLLGRGDLAVKLHVRVSRVSRSAEEKIRAAGGTVSKPD